MKLSWVPAAAALAALVTACSLSPAQAPHATPAPKPTASPSKPAPAIGSTGPVVGVNLYAVHNYSAAQTAADGARTLAYIKNDLHANAVDLVWNMYAPSYTSDLVITKAADTLTAPGIGILTRIAQQDGLYVEYRPIMFVDTTGNTWPGLIKPANQAAWFNSYYQANLPYLRMAQKYNINEYVIGTEMTGVSPDPEWPSFLARSARVFTGQISFTSDDVSFFPKPVNLPPTRLTGVDMYEGLRLYPTATLSQVVAAYEKFFTTLPASLLRRTAIQETGIEARYAAYGDPPNLTIQGPEDEAVQYNWFTAGCDAVKRFHLRGIFFWKVDLADYPVTHPAPSLSTFEGKEGATAIAKCASIVNG